MLLSEVFDRCHYGKKTGLLNIEVAKNPAFPLRVYFRGGEISRLSFGPVSGAECLECIEYYDLVAISYLDGLEARYDPVPRLPTGVIMEKIRKMGKVIRIKQWFEKGDAQLHDAKVY